MSNRCSCLLLQAADSSTAMLSSLPLVPASASSCILPAAPREWQAMSRRQFHQGWIQGQAARGATQKHGCCLLQSNALNGDMPAPGGLTNCSG